MRDDEFRDVVWIEVDGEVEGFRARRWHDDEQSYGYRASWRLFVISQVFYGEADGPAEEIWDLQDGYGEPGFMPVQGYDWSGIRDSSEQAVQAMFDVAQQHVDVAALKAALDRYAVGREVYVTLYGRVRERLEPDGDTPELRLARARESLLEGDLMVPVDDGVFPPRRPTDRIPGARKARRACR